MPGGRWLVGRRPCDREPLLPRFGRNRVLRGPWSKVVLRCWGRATVDSAGTLTCISPDKASGEGRVTFEFGDSRGRGYADCSRSLPTPVAGRQSFSGVRAFELLWADDMDVLAFTLDGLAPVYEH